jgi:hypothetical protein
MKEYYQDVHINHMKISYQVYQPLGKLYPLISDKYFYWEFLYLRNKSMSKISLYAIMDVFFFSHIALSDDTYVCSIGFILEQDQFTCSKKGFVL